MVYLKQGTGHVHIDLVAFNAVVKLGFDRATDVSVGTPSKDPDRSWALVL